MAYVLISCRDIPGDFKPGHLFLVSNFYKQLFNLNDYFVVMYVRKEYFKAMSGYILKKEFNSI